MRSRRSVIRLIGLGVALLLVVAIPAGFWLVALRNPYYMLAYWIVATCLVLGLLLVAMLDILETMRMARKARLKIIRDSLLPPRPPDGDDS